MLFIGLLYFSLALTSISALHENPVDLSTIINELEHAYATTTDAAVMRNMQARLKTLLKSQTIKNPYHAGSIALLSGRIAYSLYDFVLAKSLLEEAVATLQTHYQNELAKKLLQARVYLGITKTILTEHENSIQLLQEQIALYQKHFPEEDLDVAFALQGLAKNYRGSGCPEKSLPFIQKSVDIYAQHCPPTHMARIASEHELASVHFRMGNYTAAQQLFEEITSHRELNPHVCSVAAEVHITLAHLYSELGRYADALPIFEKNITLLKQFHPENYNLISWTLRLLVDVYVALGLYDKAKETAQEAFTFTAQHFGNDHIYTDFVLIELGIIEIIQGHYQAAEPLVYKTYLTKNNMCSTGHVNMMRDVRVLADVYAHLGKFDEAENLLHQYGEIARQYYGSNNIKYAHFPYGLGCLYALKNEPEKAACYFNEALTIYENNNHTDRYKCLEHLGDLHQNIIEKSRYHAKALAIITDAQFPQESIHYTRLKEKEQETESLNSSELGAFYMRERTQPAGKYRNLIFSFQS